MNNMQTKLYQHQLTFLRANPDKSSLIHSCGLGKTRTALEWSKLVHAPTLVVCPKALKLNWQREAERWGAKVTVVSKEEFRRDTVTLPAFGQVIVDEVHNGFLTPYFKSEMSKALRFYLKRHKVPRVLLLTATPYTSSPWNIFNLATYTGHNWDWLKFKWAFFYEVQMGRRHVPMVKPGSEKKLATLVKKIASVVDIYDVLDVPLQNHLDPEYFALNPDQEKAIKEAYDPLPIVRYTLQHEIENAVLIGNEFSPERFFKSDKNERIVSLVAENKKVAIVCRYNLQIELLSILLHDHKPYIINGQTKNRDEVCLAAEASERAVVLIQADCGLGFQLPSFGLCIYASMSYSYTSKKQMDGRFLRVDKPSRTTFIYLLTEGDSIDQAVYNCMLKKQDFSLALYKK